MSTVILSLGSNLGDRRRFLRFAIAELRKVLRVARVSSIYETNPVDCAPGTPPFLNMVAVGITTMTPEQLIAQTQRIEMAAGRRLRTRNAPRRLDIDIVTFGGVTMRTKSLLIPHPRYLQREFVLSPLRELRLAWLV